MARSSAGPILIAPTTPEGRCRVIAIVRAEEAGPWMAADDAELRRRLGARNARCGELSVERRGGSHFYRLIQQHASRYVDEGVALIGDAAHVTAPTAGQGMNLAIQDAGALADAVAPVLRDGGNGSALAAALAAYEKRRRPINARALKNADAGAWLMAPSHVRYALMWAMLAVLSAFPSLRARVRNQFGGR